MKINIAGVFVDNLTKQETLSKISEYVGSGQPHLIVTTYSEFVVFAQKDLEYKKVLNEAAVSVPDGIGILWAAKYLSLPASNLLQALWQVVYTGASIIFKPDYVRKPIPEKVTGSRLIWDIAELSNNKNYTLTLAGGENRAVTLASLKIKEKYPNLKINSLGSDEKFNEQMVQKVAATNSDILLIAYQPPNQEKWLYNNLSRLNVKVAMGLGGTFDYLAGIRIPAPDFVHSMGLEWLWRLITQPWRLRRIWNAIAVFIFTIYKFKLSKLN
jgi:N-acetylglucosaminyldiphosphoundecaprenol N-acetyl-beta-D-mannosaminyltransferase